MFSLNKKKRFADSRKNQERKKKVYFATPSNSLVIDERQSKTKIPLKQKQTKIFQRVQGRT